MGKFIKVSRDDLFNKVRQSLSGYEVSGDTQNGLMTSVFHLVSYMEKEHLSDYTPDVGISYLSTINVDKGILNTYKYTCPEEKMSPNDREYCQHFHPIKPNNSPFYLPIYTH